MPDADHRDQEEPTLAAVCVGRLRQLVVEALEAEAEPERGRILYEESANIRDVGGGRGGRDRDGRHRGAS
jgi:hypothetical protein